MSLIALFANDAVSTLAGAITNTSVTANLASGSGALFPQPVGNEYFALTFNDAATGLLDEIVWVTNVTGDTITMTRAQEGTEAQNWSAGDLASQLNTAGNMETFPQIPQVQAGLYTTAVDTGAPNAYVVALTPPVLSHNKGAPIFWQAGAANGNTGASTFNDGAGALPMVNPDGTALGTGTIVGNGYYICIADGAGHFQLVSASDEALSSQGIATTGDMKFRPTSETIPGWIPANALTIGNATSGATGLASATAAALFTWHWTNFSNTQCPVVPSGRGASAAADFAANKTIQILDWRGVSPKGIDTMGGGATTTLNNVPFTSGSATVPGSVMGENLHTLTAAQTPVITPAGAVAITASGNLALGVPSGTIGGSVSGSGITVFEAGQFATINGAFTGTPFGSGGSHNNVDLSMGVTWYLKL